MVAKTAYVKKVNSIMAKVPAKKTVFKAKKAAPKPKTKWVRVEIRRGATAWTTITIERDAPATRKRALALAKRLGEVFPQNVFQVDVT